MEGGQPQFSIVIPVNNGEDYLSHAIESALNQSRKADEIVVVNNASTDRTGDIIKSARFRGRIKYFYNDRSTGFVSSWNYAISRASGRFVTLLHHDDLLHPDYLLHVEKAIHSYPFVRHIYAACDYIDGHSNIKKVAHGLHSSEPVLYSGKEYARNYLKGIIKRRHIHRCPGVTTSRDLLLRECTYRKEAGHIADDDFFLRVGAFTDVVGISKPLASYREHFASTTSKLDSLVLSLAQDYLFQARYHMDNETLLDSEDIAEINREAVRFINLLLFQALLYGRREWIGRALGLRRKIDELLPHFMERSLPLWAWEMWQMASSAEGENHMATLYVRSLNGIIKTRDFIRSYLT